MAWETLNRVGYQDIMLNDNITRLEVQYYSSPQFVVRSYDGTISSASWIFNAPYSYVSNFDVVNYNYRVKVLAGSNTFYIPFVPQYASVDATLGSTTAVLSAGTVINMWLEREVKNRAPSTPGTPSITSPASGDIVRGSTVTLTFEKATDADGNSIRYHIQPSYWDGSKWTNYGETTTSYYTGTGNQTATMLISSDKTDTKVRFRVRAYDGQLYSEYTSYTAERNLVNPNTAPTTPGVFTNPSGDLEIGDVKAISWGASTDAEGGTLTYELGVSINGGAYSVLGTTTSPSYNYTIPTATSLKFRVRTQDSGGLWSSYRESALFTVTKPKYYYSKHNAVKKVLEYTQTDWLTKDWMSNEPNGTLYYLSYSFNPTTGQFSGTGTAYNSPAVGRYFSLSNGAHRVDTNPTYDYDNSMYTFKSSWKYSVESRVTYEIGSTLQTNIIAEDGTYPSNDRHTDGYWYLRGSRVNQSVAPPQPFTSPEAGKVFRPGDTASIVFGASSAPDLSVYEVDYRYGEGAWTSFAYNNTLTRSLTITTDKSLKTVQYRVRAKNTSNVYSDYVYSEVYTIQHNLAPTLTLNTADNRTLYENDTFVLDGTVTDGDIGNVVTVRYQLNALEAKPITTYIEDGSGKAYSKTLTFTQGKLHDGVTALTEALIEGEQYYIRVWAEDDQGGKSSEIIRNFTVVPNRQPNLTIDPLGDLLEQIDTDKLTISGNVSDPDGNDVTVKYKVGSGAYTTIYEGSGGAFSFDLTVGELLTGVNTVTIRATDSHGVNTDKIIDVTKSGTSTPLKQSVVRYKVTPPNGSASGVILWIQREVGDLVVGARASMVNEGEAENFQDMTIEDSVPLTDVLYEDEYIFDAGLPKSQIVLELVIQRADTASTSGIKLITGVLN